MRTSCIWRNIVSCDSGVAKDSLGIGQFRWWLILLHLAPGCWWKLVECNGTRLLITQWLSALARKFGDVFTQAALGSGVIPMATPPDPVRLFHITAMANLPAICQAKAILAKNHGQQYINIAHQGAQGARSGRAVPNPPGGVVHDYVPLFYAPRSPMLFAINCGRVDGCQLKQEEIVHFEFSLPSALADGAPFVIFDRNATLSYAGAYTSLNDLDKVAWDLFFEAPLVGDFSKYFHDRQTDPRHADRREKRMAEFLVKGCVMLSRCTRIGVINAAKQAEARAIVQKAGLTLLVDVRPDWYFL